MMHEDSNPAADSSEPSGRSAPGSQQKLYVLIGYFKAGESQPADLQAAFNEHLAQPFFQLKLAGYLRDRNGDRKGYMGLLAADDMDRADAFLKASPYFRAGLYDRTELLELDLEVGNLG